MGTHLRDLLLLAFPDCDNGQRFVATPRAQELPPRPGGSPRSRKRKQVPERVGRPPILSSHLKTGQWWSYQNRPTDLARDSVILPLCLLIRQVHFGAPTARGSFENVTVIEEAVEEHCGDGGAVTAVLSPVFHRTVGSQQCAGQPIAPA